MKMKIKNNNKGFTLVEILIAIAVSAIIMGAIAMAMRSGLYSAVGIEAKVSTQQDARAALEIMATEIRMASENRTSELNQSNSEIWADLATTAGQNCTVLTSAPTNKEARGIREATPNSLTIQADINGDGIIGSSGQPNEVIRYVYVNTGGDQYITRCTCCTNSSTGGGGQPLLGDTIASGTSRVVRVINNTTNPVTPVFRYFNRTGTEFTPNWALTTCEVSNNHICNITRIDITLVVESDTLDPMTGQRGRQIHSISVVPQNHVYK